MAQKSFYRSDRVSAQIRRELGTIVRSTVREHGLPSVSVSDVEITRDLAHAKVFVTALQEERSKEAVKALKELAPQMRYQLGKAMKLRHVPELHFHYDDSVDRGERIDNLLRDNPPRTDLDDDVVDGADAGAADNADPGRDE
ncbi:30S ribosome-binding factor RbfA [Montanilutibacter psychrotolerans]|uniref:Ribosome-binding factor A n=1 Tax=Montanilutibacter psychrotolerans TaxID=1327343 RepID=A0A3M8T0K8_9GAMM|nr:30S ribosome-binding factor RbfA [Lysobacter psychrotolerans]RNF85206.1 30S ribosome-binding factor RbfA [Lysobacter psychrotolerans]